MTKELYIFSGLGADERVFQRIDFSGFSTTFIKWIVPQDKETIENYATRLLDQITTTKPTLIGLSFGGLIAVEIVFNYPGFGTILKGAVDARDYAVLQAGVVISSLVIVSFQLIADILFAVLNPRIRQKISE